MSQPQRNQRRVDAGVQQLHWLVCRRMWGVSCLPCSEGHRRAAVAACLVIRLAIASRVSRAPVLVGKSGSFGWPACSRSQLRSSFRVLLVSGVCRAFLYEAHRFEQPGSADDLVASLRYGVVLFHCVMSTKIRVLRSEAILASDTPLGHLLCRVLETRRRKLLPAGAPRVGGRYVDRDPT